MTEGCEAVLPVSSLARPPPPRFAARSPGCLLPLSRRHCCRRDPLRVACRPPRSCCTANPGAGSERSRTPRLLPPALPSFDRGG